LVYTGFWYIAGFGLDRFLVSFQGWVYTGFWYIVGLGLYRFLVYCRAWFIKVSGILQGLV
jgi:hypothetical protein